MISLNKRQKDILDYIKKNQPVGNKNIVDFLKDWSRFTVLRDLALLEDKKLILKEGKGRGVAYKLFGENPLLSYIDIEEYFKEPIDNRKIIKGFNFDIYNNLDNIFDTEELNHLHEMTGKYNIVKSNLSNTIVEKEFERLTIELSWKSSQIEGNTYSLLETEVLIKQNQEAKGKKREEAIMILNHKKALDYARNKKAGFQKLSIRNIENIHSLIADGLGIEKGVRKRLVGITGTNYKPLDNEFQIKDALADTIKIINKAEEPFTKAVLAILLVSYIQPFEDGNKRTSRLLGNAVLMAHDCCPLSYRSIDEVEYKKAVLLFYEQNNLSYFKQLFIEQYEFAVNNYFSA